MEQKAVQIKEGSEIELLLNSVNANCIPLEVKDFAMHLVNELWIVAKVDIIPEVYKAK